MPHHSLASNLLKILFDASLSRYAFVEYKHNAEMAHEAKATTPYKSTIGEHKNGTAELDFTS